MELSKGATAALIAVVVVLVLGLGWFFFLRPPGGGTPVPAGQNAPETVNPNDPAARFKAMQGRRPTGVNNTRDVSGGGGK